MSLRPQPRLWVKFGHGGSSRNFLVLLQFPGDVVPNVNPFHHPLPEGNISPAPGLKAHRSPPFSLGLLDVAIVVGTAGVENDLMQFRREIRKQASAEIEKDVSYMPRVSLPHGDGVPASGNFGRWKHDPFIDGKLTGEKRAGHHSENVFPTKHLCQMIPIAKHLCLCDYPKIMEQTKEEILHEHYVLRGRKGGKSKSLKKKKAILYNMEKALEKRWGKKIRIRKPKDA